MVVLSDLFTDVKAAPESPGGSPQTLPTLRPGDGANVPPTEPGASSSGQDGQSFLEWIKDLKETGRFVGGEIAGETQRLLESGERVPLILHIGPAYTSELCNAAQLRDEQGTRAIIVGIDPLYEYYNFYAGAMAQIQGVPDTILIKGRFQEIPEIQFNEIRTIDQRGPFVAFPGFTTNGRGRVQ